MAENLVASTTMNVCFNPIELRKMAKQNWESVEWQSDPPGMKTPGNGQMQIAVGESTEGAKTVLLVDFLRGGRGLGLHGDDEAVAIFLSLLACHMEFVYGDIVTTDWSHDILTLEPGISYDELQNLRRKG